MKTQFVAFDGTVFEDCAECEQYENRHVADMGKMPVMLDYNHEKLFARTPDELERIYEDCVYLYFRDEEEIGNFLKYLDEYFVNQIGVKFKPRTLYKYSNEAFAWEDFDDVARKIKKEHERVMQIVWGETYEILSVNIHV